MSESQDRRAFLATAGVTVASVVTPRLIAQPPGVPQFPGTRESVGGMDADHPTLAAYRKAIEAMKKLDKDNPKSPLGWRFQANMHGALDEDGDNYGWRWCMHANSWFLPWHRGYIYFFEKIVRKLSGDDTFRLPYWAWEKDRQNVLPVPFREPKYQGRDNVLFDGTRREANGGGPLRSRSRSGSFARDWESTRAVERFTTRFPELSFGGLRRPKTTLPNKPATSGPHGAMESQAHDLLHVAVAGANGNMGDADTAARDPIFWLHHANVDRLWNRWMDERGHYLPDPDTDKDWYDQQFPFFDENGKEVVVTVQEILDLAGRAARYDDDRRLFFAGPREAKEKPVESKIVSVGAVQPMLALGTKPVTKSLAIAEETKPRLMTALADAPVQAEPPAVLLRVEGIKPPKEAQLTYEVFLMKKGDKPSPRTYVGPITFFGRRAGGRHGHDDVEGFTQGFDVTDVVQKLRSANKGQIPELDVAVVPHSTAGLSDEDLAKKEVVIPISNITLQLVTADKK